MDLEMNGSASGNHIPKEKQQRSLWVSSMETKLRILKQELQSEISDQFQILKVLEYHRQPAVEYTPVGWRSGLHNRENVNIIGAEAVKPSIVVLFGLEEQLQWESFCDEVVPLPKSMLMCYGLHEETTDHMMLDEIKQVLALDALSLAAMIDIFYVDERSQRLYTSEHVRSSIESEKNIVSTLAKWEEIITYDLCKIENQIPFALIKRAIKHIIRLTNPQYDARTGQMADPYLEEWMKVAVVTGMSDFMDISHENEDAYPGLSTSAHVLDAAHKAICGVNGMQRTRDLSVEDYIHIPSATRLRASGIKIEGAVKPLCTMSYNKDKTCLFLPKMKIYDQTVALVRNMAEYELHSEEGCMFHDYIILMLDLIQTPQDLKFLTDHGVINNECGLQKGFEMWKSLDQGMRLVESSTAHNEMKKDINSRCKLRRHRFWSEFRTLFLSRPWLTLSTIAVVLVTAATLIQTYATIIGSNGMKPQFKP